MRTNVLIAVAALAVLASCGAQQTSEAPAPPITAIDIDDRSGGMTVAASPSAAFVVGRPVTLTVRLADAAGKAIGADDLSVKHEHLLHVMTVDVGLQDYAHAHPSANADGSFSFTFTPRLDRPYRLWADFSLKDTGAGMIATQSHSGEHHDMAASAQAQGAGSRFVSVDLPVGTGAAAPVAPTQTLTAEAEGLRLQLSLESELRVGVAAKARLAVTDTKGDPYTKLEPLMGAFAHVVGFDPGATTIMHVHPEGAEPTMAGDRGGPVLSFMLKPDRAGPNRLFAQIKANGREIAVPFTVVVSP